MTAPGEIAPGQDPAARDRHSFVTATIAGQLFGIPIGRAHDVFTAGAVTPVPLAPPDVLGLMNLRGRVVTALDIRQRLGLRRPHWSRARWRSASRRTAMPSASWWTGSARSSAVNGGSIENNPAHLDPAWAELSRGIYRLETELLVVLDVDAVLETVPQDPRTFTRSGELAMKHCLVVDDSAVIRKVACRIMEGLALRTSEAEDGEQALMACRREMPDAILLDWNMPVMDGYEFSRRSGRCPAGRLRKVVFCTTENDVACIARRCMPGPTNT
jgi:two-component system chemotaxis response regulator CheY